MKTFSGFPEGEKGYDLKKIEESFKESSEVSNTLLGVNRAEVQLSLFSNVSSYGLDPDEFETYSYTGGNSFGSWDRRFISKFALYH